MSVLNRSDEKYIFPADGKLESWSDGSWKALGYFIGTTHNEDDPAGVLSTDGGSPKMMLVPHVVEPGAESSETFYLTVAGLQPGWYRLSITVASTQGQGTTPAQSLLQVRP